MANTSPIRARLDFAVQAARDVSPFILSHFQNADLEVISKFDATPVTVADRGAEELLRARIGERFPDDGILGEEFGEKPSGNGYRWILDPIDGTKSFVHGVPLFGTLIGLERGEDVVLGVCRFPALDEVVYAARGSGAWWQIRDFDPRRVRVSEVARLSEGLFCTTTISRWERIGRRDAFEKLVDTARLSRGWGDCYGHMLVATGRAEVMVDTAMNPWDAAALLPIVEEAGGHFLDWKGQPTIHGGNGVSVNAAIRNEVLEILRAKAD